MLYGLHFTWHAAIMIAANVEQLVAVSFRRLNSGFEHKQQHCLWFALSEKLSMP